MHKSFIGFRDRVLLHLLRFEKEVYDNIHGAEVDGLNIKFLNHLTQEGIAEGIGTKQSSIFKELHALCLPVIEGEEPLIKSIEKVRIPGRERVCTIYFLTQFGDELARQKLHYLEEKNVETLGLDDSEVQLKTVKELMNRLVDDCIEPNHICALLRIAAMASPEGIVNWQDLISPELNKCDYEKQSEPTQPVMTSYEEVINPYFNRIAIKDQKYFFGRENEVRYIVSLLQNTQSCSIIGPRRIGKSSIINAISNPDMLKKNGLNPENYVFVFIDLEGLVDLTQSEFFYLIVEELRNHITDKDIRELLETVISKEDIRFIDLKKIFRYLTKMGKKVIFLFDEFELITNNKNLDFNFFSGLRNLANSYKVGYITASHMPLLELTFSKQTLGSPFFNFFAQIEINLMSDNAINEIITIPSGKHGLVFQENVKDFIINTAGLHPFFTQVMCFHLFDWIKINGTITETDLPKIEKTFMNEAEPHFQYFWNHLSSEEQQYLKSLKNNGSKIESAENKSIIHNLKKKALVMENNDGLALFSNAFSNYVSSAEIISTQKMDKSEVLPANEGLGETDLKIKPDIRVRPEDCF